MLTDLHYLAWGCCGGCPALQTCCYQQHHLTPQSLCCTGQWQQGCGPSASSGMSALVNDLTSVFSSDFFPILFFCIYSLFSCLLIWFHPAALHSLNLTLCCMLGLLYCVLLLSSPVLSYPIPSHRYTYKHLNAVAYKHKWKLRFCTIQIVHMDQ